MSKNTSDRFLGGKIVIRQPAAGFRAGLDSVLLAAAVPAREKDVVLELGSGVGVVSLCLAARVGCDVTGCEIDRALVTLAERNARDNGFEKRMCFIKADALANPKELRREFDHVFVNPPFHGAAGRASPLAKRARAMKDRVGLEAWIHAGLKRTRSGGTLTMIVRADRLHQCLCGPMDEVSVFPLWPRDGVAAKRVLVQWRKARRGGLKLLPGLVLHDEKGFRPEADAVLRGDARIAFRSE